MRTLLAGLTMITAFALLYGNALAQGRAKAGTTCDQAVRQCQLEGSNKPNIIARCQAAGEKCKKTGVFVGPVTGRSWRIPGR